MATTKKERKWMDWDQAKRAFPPDTDTREMLERLQQRHGGDGISAGMGLTLAIFHYLDALDRGVSAWDISERVLCWRRTGSAPAMPDEGYAEVGMIQMGGVSYAVRVARGRILLKKGRRWKRIGAYRDDDRRELILSDVATDRELKAAFSDQLVKLLTAR